MTKDEIISAAKVILWMLTACAIVSMCSSCSSAKYVPIPSTSAKTEYVYKTDTVYKDRVRNVYNETERHDTVYMKDSTRVIVDVSGNVVRTDHYRTEKSLSHDNTYISQFDSLVTAYSRQLIDNYRRTDSIAVAYPVGNGRKDLVGSAGLFIALMTCIIALGIVFKVKS